uniref:HAT C-terminal dimerisation domain-containing protein n=1 Tax=Aegilops tauschii subsp. strangulata TaxID=200361 RepID=A0A453IE32_AEGTS
MESIAIGIGLSIMRNSIKCFASVVNYSQKGIEKLRTRLQKHETIDKAAQRQLESEKEHWRKVLSRIVCIVKFLARHNLAFRGTNRKLYEDSNGNLGLVEMLAEFDPVIQEHVRRITNEETHTHYLDFKIQNELIHLLASAIRKWQILKNNITGLTPKSVSATRWESRVDSVKAIRLQCADIREALLQVSETDNDTKTSSEAKGLANNELGEYVFIVAIVIWYEVLYAVNLVSKHLQAKDMLIGVAIEKVQGLLSFFKGYRDTGFLEALEIAKVIALEMDIGTTFHKRREIKRKRHFDENPDDANVATQSAEESFRVNYFLRIVDQAILSLTSRFDQYHGYQKIFGFLFTSETLQSLDKNSLKTSCDNLEVALEKDGKSDIDANELYVELMFLQNFMPKENIGPVEILKFLKRHDCFPNACIAYRVLLTIPVTVTSAERSFSKLKLLKSYMHTTMTQQRLTDLATIALESNLLDKIDYEDIIEDFITKNTKRMMLFK